jgi:hypothetical protein
MAHMQQEVTNESYLISTVPVSRKERMNNNPSTFDGAKDKYESLPLTEMVIRVSEYTSELEK